jgi:hypothetical protein
VSVPFVAALVAAVRPLAHPRLLSAAIERI